MEYRVIEQSAQLSDQLLDEIALVIKESWRKLYRNLDVYEESYEQDTSFWGAPMIEKELAAGNRWLLGLEDGRCVAAVLLEEIQEEGERAVMLRMLGVLPDQQGKSLGTLLIERAEQIAREEGNGRLTLFTSSLLTTLVAFYKRNGFHEYRREEVERFGLRYDRVFLDRRLD